MEFSPGCDADAHRPASLDARGDFCDQLARSWLPRSIPQMPRYLATVFLCKDTRISAWAPSAYCVSSHCALAPSDDHPQIRRLSANHLWRRWEFSAVTRESRHLIHAGTCHDSQHVSAPGTARRLISQCIHVQRAISRHTARICIKDLILTRHFCWYLALGRTHQSGCGKPVHFPSARAAHARTANIGTDGNADETSALSPRTKHQMSFCPRTLFRTLFRTLSRTLQPVPAVRHKAPYSDTAAPPLKQASTIIYRHRQYVKYGRECRAARHPNSTTCKSSQSVGWQFTKALQFDS